MSKSNNKNEIKFKPFNPQDQSTYPPKSSVYKVKFKNGWTGKVLYENNNFTTMSSDIVAWAEIQKH